MPGDRAQRKPTRRRLELEKLGVGEAQYSGFRERQLVDQLACLLLARDVEQELGAGVIGAPVGADDDALVAKLFDVPDVEDAGIDLVDWAERGA